ncbi:hypothetical protein, partial [Actinotignum timonense]|uniref:hypothetical protein n=1 Tax=Actinotignum timonense TaxID=1870995 RepID=UPI002A7F361C
MSVAYQEIPRETSRAHTSRRHPKLRVVGEHPAAVHRELRGGEVRCGDDRGGARGSVRGVHEQRFRQAEAIRPGHIREAFTE